jgi:Protein of unknown function (DUF669)
MADLGDTFDPADVPESNRNFDPFPAGNYIYQITESDVVDIANGLMLKLTFEVMEGPYANRKVFANLCIRHSNEQTQSIAQRDLADLFLATNTPRSRNSDDLHFKPFVGRTIVKRDKKGEYGPKNVIIDYKPLAGKATVTPPAQKANGFAKATPAAAKSAPWRRPAATQVRTPPFDDDTPF